MLHPAYVWRVYVSLQRNITFKKDAWEVARDMLVQKMIVMQPEVAWPWASCIVLAENLHEKKEKLKEKCK